MSKQDEATRIDENLKGIRGYLTKCFEGFEITEDRSDQSMYHIFTVTKQKDHQQFKLKVGWPRLSDRSNTLERCTRALTHGDVAGKMGNAKGTYFYR